jgi:hypothetical protein
LEAAVIGLPKTRGVDMDAMQFAYSGSFTSQANVVESMTFAVDMRSVRRRRCRDWGTKFAEGFERADKQIHVTSPETLTISCQFRFEVLGSVQHYQVVADYNAATGVQVKAFRRYGKDCKRISLPSGTGDIRPQIQALLADIRPV